jgi:hypothetical protein
VVILKSNGGESGDRTPRRSAVDVFYHPEHGSAVEIWDIGGDIAADVPGEGVVTGQQAASVLYACLDSDDVDHRRI